MGVDEVVWGTQDDQEDWYGTVKQYVDENIESRTPSMELTIGMIGDDDEEEGDQHWREEQESKDDWRVITKDPEQPKPTSTINDDQDHPAKKAPVPTFQEVGDQDRVEDGTVDPVPNITPLLLLYKEEEGELLDPRGATAEQTSGPEHNCFDEDGRIDDFSEQKQVLEAGTVTGGADNGADHPCIKLPEDQDDQGEGGDDREKLAKWITVGQWRHLVGKTPAIHQAR